MNWHILDPLGGEEWIKFMCGAERFLYEEYSFPKTLTVRFIIPKIHSHVTIRTGEEVLVDEINWYRIHCNSESSPFIRINQKLILPEQKGLAMQHFENLTGLTLTF
jgi:hypothetical protein